VNLEQAKIDFILVEAREEPEAAPEQKTRKTKKT
jgi:hypothetical protein